MTSKNLLHCATVIITLTGSATRLDLGEVVMNVNGVGYRVLTPVDAWERIEEGKEATLWISTYVREDRFELFGFLDKHTRTLFELLIAQSGIGPKTALEICAVPRDMLHMAVHQNDVKLLTGIKGIGKKTAEKLLLELRSLVEKHSEAFAGSADGDRRSSKYDQDAVEALTALGYDTPSVMDILKKLPEDVHTTEERVAAALRSL